MCDIFNTNFTGSPMWNVFCLQSIKLMFDIILNLFRNKNIWKHFWWTNFWVLSNRSISLQKSFQTSFFRPSRMIVDLCYLRKIWILTYKEDFSKLVPNDANQIRFNPIKEDDEWKLDMLNELTDAKFGEANIQDLHWMKWKWKLNIILSLFIYLKRK